MDPLFYLEIIFISIYLSVIREREVLPKQLLQLTSAPVISPTYYVCILLLIALVFKLGILIVQLGILIGRR